MAKDFYNFAKKATYHQNWSHLERAKQAEFLSDLIWPGNHVPTEINRNNQI